MPYRHFRRRKVYFNYNIKPISPGKRVLLILMVYLLLFSAAVSIVLIRLRPVILKLAESEVNKVVMDDINDVIGDEMSAGSLAYGKLITVEKDYNGNVTALETNMAAINMLQAKLSKGITDRIDTSVISDLKIPIGNAVGGAIFSGRGPMFDVKILSVTYVRTRFTNSFSDAGINQTRHKIMLEVSTDVALFVPGYRDASTNVTTEVEVAETVIVGRVPNVYADIGGSS